jgi:ubiquinone/menaquinone biosynthesis C-methylase UbiE
VAGRASFRYARALRVRGRKIDDERSIMSAGPVFTGAMPAFYDRYMGPLAFAGYAGEMVERLRVAPPARLLETGCGTGVVTYAAAEAFPQTEIVATDVSGAMIDFAKAKRPGANITWREADAQALPFSAGGFDAVMCGFGVMFFPNKRQAFREAKRVLAPGGRFVFSVWDGLEANEIHDAVFQAVAALFPDDPPSFMRRVPFGYHDADAIRADLRAAGFADVTVETVARELHAPDAREPAIGLCQGGSSRAEIEARDPGGLERATDRVAAAVEARFGSGPISARSRALFVTAA